MSNLRSIRFWLFSWMNFWVKKFLIKARKTILWWLQGKNGRIFDSSREFEIYVIRWRASEGVKNLKTVQLSKYEPARFSFFNFFNLDTLLVTFYSLTVIRQCTLNPIAGKNIFSATHFHFPQKIVNFCNLTFHFCSQFCSFLLYVNILLFPSP